MFQRVGRVSKKPTLATLIGSSRVQVMAKGGGIMVRIKLREDAWRLKRKEV